MRQLPLAQIDQNIENGNNSKPIKKVGLKDKPAAQNFDKQQVLQSHRKGKSSSNLPLHERRGITKVASY